ncbi:transposase [Pseudoalteromonas luteoviolacea]|uniref:Transposase IS4-like domain-containing protein n=1 Tax=Pseudoalteromonas luteoviolacea NCIMB 1942 TaxID=1365253 RepID=A0A161XW02_9GAMM|nr:transposase [Pseudoalteromonas luteoviolacea]KZN47359.1 hypothetical protein N482_09795 [Pseudoalteromonas luteoviolacea NCIMB 1942]
MAYPKTSSQQGRTWRKLHLAIDTDNHDIVSAELSMVNVSDSEVLGDLIRPLRRNVDRVTSDDAYHTRDCDDEIAAKGVVARIPPRENAQY